MATEPEPAGLVTQLLHAAGRGDNVAADRVFPLIYEQLIALARSHMRHENPGHTLANQKWSLAQRLAQLYLAWAITDNAAEWSKTAERFRAPEPATDSAATQPDRQAQDSWHPRI